MSQNQQRQSYLVGEELDCDVVFIKSVPESHHVFGTAAAVLDHGDHFTILKQLLQLPLH